MRLLFLHKKDFFSPNWNRYHPARIKDYPGLDSPFGKVDLYRRPHSGKLPVILYLHDCFAPIGRQHRKGICRALAEYGCAVLCPDIKKDSYPSQLTKIVSLAEWAVQNAHTFGLDTERVIFAGDGFGAFLAAAICRLLTDPVFAGRMGIKTILSAPVGAVLFSGFYELPDPLAKTRKARSLKRFAKAVFGEEALEDRKKYAFAPLSAARTGLPSAYPPVFFSHSPGDIYCSGQGDVLRKALETAGVPYWECYAAESKGRHGWNLNPFTEEARACNAAAGDFIEKIKNGNPGCARFDI